MTSSKLQPVSSAQGQSVSDATDYFALRGVGPDAYTAAQLPRWLSEELRRLPPNAKVLDFGCGFGQTMRGVRSGGTLDVVGADINATALAFVRSAGFVAYDVSGGIRSSELCLQSFDCIVTTHVLEHIPKSSAVETLRSLKSLLAPKGILLVAVPNAQAFTGAYWAYEDFTHETLYTYGSLMYVLKAAGFSQIDLLDREATAGLRLPQRILRRLFSKLYGLHYSLMKKMLASTTHIASVDVFTYEVKMRASCVKPF